MTNREKTIMSSTHHGRLIALLVVAGLALGALGALIYTSRPDRYRAHAVLAMLPGPSIGPADQTNAWLVLTRGQATRTGAIVLSQRHWLDAAARDVRAAPDDLTLAAGAVPETTLIDVTLDAGSAATAETALSAVLDKASPEAAGASGPFTLGVVEPPAGTATSQRPPPLPTYLALMVAGAAAGAGAGLLIGRRRQPAMVTRAARPDGADAPVADAPAPDDGRGDGTAADAALARNGAHTVPSRRPDGREGGG